MDLKTFRCEACGKISTALDVEAGAGVFHKGRYFCTTCVPRPGFSPLVVGAAAAAVVLAVLLGATFRLSIRLGALERDLQRARSDEAKGREAFRDEVRKAIEGFDERSQKAMKGVADRFASLEKDARQTRYEVRAVQHMAQETIRQALERAPSRPEAPPLPGPRLPPPSPGPARGGDGASAPGVPPGGSENPAVPGPARGAGAPAEPPGAPPAATPLSLWAERLKDRDKGVRYSAVHQLGGMADEAVDPLLASALDDESPPVRAHAAKMLGKRSAQRAVPPLIERLDDPDAYVRYCAHEALRQITGGDPGYPESDDPALRGPVLKAWREWIRKGSPAAAAPPEPRSGG